MKSFFLKNWVLIILIFLSVIFSFIYSYLAISIKGDLYGTMDKKLIFNSPDETANYFFSHLYAEKGQLNYAEPDNSMVDGLIAPRSTRYVNGHVVPTSFFGLMVIVGLTARLFSLKIMVFIIPVISSFGLIFFYLLIKKIFNKEIAFISTIIAFTFPAYWYYASRSFFNNILFLDFFIIGLYFFIKFLENKNYFAYFISGYFLGLAIFVRTSEVIWVFLLIISLILFNFKKIKLLGIMLFILAVILSWLPILYYNQKIYGQLFTIGYNYSFSLIDDNFIGGGLNIFKQLLLPFGWQWINIKNNFINYFLDLYWWYFILFETAVCFIITKILNKNLTKNISKKQLMYFILFAIFSFYLIILYGSWKFYDNPDPSAITLGTSYNRYFLPIYIFSLPLIFYFIFRFFIKFKLLKNIIYLIIIFIFYFCSYNLVFLDNLEGLIKINSNINEYQLIAKQIIPATSGNSIIIAEKNDKIFFPVRSVIYQLNNDKDNILVGSLLNKREIYWWRFKLNEADLKFIQTTNSQKGYGWYLDKAKACYKNQCLYELIAEN